MASLHIFTFVGNNFTSKNYQFIAKPIPKNLSSIVLSPIFTFPSTFVTIGKAVEWLLNALMVANLDDDQQFDGSGLTLTHLNEEKNVQIAIVHQKCRWAFLEP